MTREPVTGSGSAPAWTCWVVKPYGACVIAGPSWGGAGWGRIGRSGPTRRPGAAQEVDDEASRERFDRHCGSLPIGPGGSTYPGGAVAAASTSQVSRPLWMALPVDGTAPTRVKRFTGSGAG
ncbi:hypothetical protein GCM10009528_44020 [Kineococcus aurantiacus]